MRKKIVVAGTGYLEIINLINEMKIDECEYELIGFLDDNKENFKRNLYGYKILGGFDWIINNKDVLVINSIFRDCDTRYKTTNKLLNMGAKLTKVIHKSVSCDVAKIGKGSIIGRNAVIEKGSHIGKHCVILHNTVIAHDTNIGEYCFLGHNVSIQGFNSIGNKVFIGTGSTSSPDIKIKNNSKIGLNCNLIKNVDEDAILIPPLPKRIK